MCYYTLMRKNPYSEKLIVLEGLDGSGQSTRAGKLFDFLNLSDQKLKFGHTGVHLTKAQLREIAKTKMPDLNATDLESAMKIIEGTAKNMGITIE